MPSRICLIAGLLLAVLAAIAQHATAAAALPDMIKAKLKTRGKASKGELVRVVAPIMHLAVMHGRALMPDTWLALAEGHGMYVV